MATDVSIQAVSPELGEQFVSVLASQDGGAAAAAAAGASAAVSAIAEWKLGKLSKIARRSAPARANSPARENRLKVMVSLLSVFIEVRGY
jgi:fatty acid/phospholipid biosynthesis enzyme